MMARGRGATGHGLAERLLAERLSGLMAVPEAPPRHGLAATGHSIAGNPETRRRLAEARRSFADGFRTALAAHKDGLGDLFRDMPVPGRGFALEGGAMGSTLFDEFSGRGEGGRLCRLRSGRNRAEQFLIGLGAGMAGARLGRPFEWVPVGIGPEQRRAVADGYGFHQAFFSAGRFLERGFPAQPGRWSSDYDVGLGRGLFFAAEGDAEAIGAMVEMMPRDRRGSIWRGIGTAGAFTGAGAGTGRGPGWGRFDSDLRAGVEVGLQMAGRLARETTGETVA